MNPPADINRYLGLALTVLRRSRGLTLAQLGNAAKLGAPKISNYETGRQLPRIDNLARIADAMGLPLAAIYQAQALVQEAATGVAPDDDGTMPDHRMTREDAVRLAQEAGKAVAHVVLVWLELQAGGWSLAERQERKR